MRTDDGVIANVVVVNSYWREERLPLRPFHRGGAVKQR
jgi:hypothetical protein